MRYSDQVHANAGTLKAPVEVRVENREESEQAAKRDEENPPREEKHEVHRTLTDARRVF